jgi:hypothetical protein
VKGHAAAIHWGDVRVGALLFRRVNVDAAEQGRFRVVKQRVIEPLAGGDLGFVAGQVLPVFLARHRVGRPFPGRTEDRPQPWLRAHHRRVIQINVRGPDRAQMVALTDWHHGGVNKVSRQPGHGP